MSGTTSGPDESGESADEDRLDSSAGEGGSSPLRRRTVLGGFAATGTAGALSATGLYGLDAFLSDAELFGNGTVEEANAARAGELDLGIAWESYHDPADGSRERVGKVGDCEDEAFVDGSTAAIDLTDVQPGDAGSAEFCLRPVGSPGWLWVETSCPESGLERALEATLRYDAGCDGDVSPMVTASGESVSDLSGSLCAVLSTLGAGVRLGTTCVAPETSHCLTLDWSFPAAEYHEQYQEYEGEELTFELEFVAVQCRHNPDPSPPSKRSCDPGRCTDSGPAISWIAYCTEDDQIEHGDVEHEILDTTGDGNPTKVGWRSQRQLSTVVIYYGTQDGPVIENFFVADGYATGTATVGEGDELTAAASDEDQSPSDPAPDGETAIKYEYDETTGAFELDQ